MYGDGIQADTYALIAGGEVSLHTLPTFIAATSSEGCFKLTNGLYTRVAADSAKNFANLYQ